MLKLQRVHNIMKEAKQVGVLYHFCTLYNVSDYIAPNDELKPSGLFYNRMLKTRNIISFTRNSSLRLNTLRSYKVTVRFTVNGDLLSNNHKIVPFSYFGVSKPQPKDLDHDMDEMEEVVVGTIKDFHKYILGIQVRIKDTNVEIEDLVNKYTKEKDIYFSFSSLLNYINKYNLNRKNVTVIDANGKEYTLNQILVKDIDDPEKIYKDQIKRRDLSVIRLLDKDSLYDLFYNIVHNIDDDYIYDLAINVGENIKQLSEEDKKKVRDVFIAIYNIVEGDDLETFKEDYLDIYP